MSHYVGHALIFQQTHAGIFQLLPLGLRVQEKIEKIIDWHMRSLGIFAFTLSIHP